jgi:hypothetical protein
VLSETDSFTSTRDPLYQSIKPTLTNLFCEVGKHGFFRLQQITNTPSSDSPCPPTSWS